MSAWAPLLEGRDRQRAMAAIAAIAEALGDELEPEPSRSVPLAAGDAGVALFFAYLERAQPGNGFGGIAVQRLERAIDDLAHQLRSPGLYSGFTGVAWVAEHLEDCIGDEDANEEIDEALLDFLSVPVWRDHFDLTSGLTGIGLYALERGARPTARALLAGVIDHLAARAASRPGGLAWHTDPPLLQQLAREWYPEGYDNLGVAHGVPGVIGLLARAVAAGSAVERARPLLDASVSWLLAQELPPGGVSIFPYCVGKAVRVRPARTAWCYGDAGIAATLLLAARATGLARWEDTARRLAREVARRTPAECGVRDAGLCHGGAGLGHVLHRLYRATGDEELAAAAHSWFARILDERRLGRGVAGFLSWGPRLDDPTLEMEWVAARGFLTGVAGIGLALLAATSAVEPAWDRVLLLSPFTEGHE